MKNTIKKVLKELQLIAQAIHSIK